MIILIIHTVISFLLDGLMSNYITTNILSPSFLRTIYTVISLVIIFNYFENKRKYLYILLVLGCLFYIFYTNIFIINIFILYIIYFILKQLDYFIPNNLLTINIKSLIAIFIYHIMTYLLLLISNYHYFPSKLLWLILTRSIIMTVIYTSISFLILKKIFFKKYDKKIK